MVTAFMCGLKVEYLFRRFTIICSGSMEFSLHSIEDYTAFFPFMFYFNVA